MIELYTTYISKVKDVPADVLKVFVCRYLPNSISMDNSIHSLKLAPSANLFARRKSKEISYELFKKEYISELERKGLNFKNVNSNKLCFICYEKYPSTCHRKILAEYLQSKGDFIYKGEI